MTLILLAISATITLCIIAWYLAIYALPVMVALTIFQWTFAADTGFFLSALAALGAALVSVILVIAAISFAKKPFLRFAALGLFSVPAAIAGYALVNGVTMNALDPGLVQTLLNSMGGLVASIAAVVNLNALGTSALSR